MEAFGGSASVLLRKGRSWLEVYNDLDDDVVSFFRILRERPDDLVRMLELTPYARQEWEQAMTDDNSLDPLEKARRFYIRSYMNLAGPTGRWRSGWRRQKVISKEHNTKKMTPAAISFMNLDHLGAIVQRLRGVQLECDDALNVVARFDSPQTLFYIDPPYPADTRGRWKRHAYKHEMTDEQHTHLAQSLHDVQGMVVVSGYWCTLIANEYGHQPCSAW